MFKIRHLKKNIIKRFWRVKGDGGGAWGCRKGAKQSVPVAEIYCLEKKYLEGPCFTSSGHMLLCPSTFFKSFIAITG